MSTPTKHPLQSSSLTSPASPDAFLDRDSSNNNSSLTLRLDSPMASTSTAAFDIPPTPPSVESHTKGLLSSNSNNNNSSSSSSGIELSKRNLNLVDDITEVEEAVDEENGGVIALAAAAAGEEEVEEGAGSPSKKSNKKIDKILHYIEKAAEIVCMPATFVFHYTIPSMKINMESGEELDHAANNWYPLTICASASWVILDAYVLCLCFSVVGHFFGISSAVVGLTLSAAGTSFPNFWSSIVAAKIGRGDMAISNALGSCTFCFFFCLGFPWLLYNIIEGEYNTMLDGGIVLLTIVLCIINVGYYTLIALNNFIITKWMGALFCAVYAVVITAICIYFP